jgi:nucleotide-binding universal stress UspA family protein
MVRISRILCPVDFSEFSRHALDRAVAIAADHGSTVTVQHMVPILTPLLVSPYWVAGRAPIGLTHVERGRLLGHLREFVEGRGRAGVPIDYEVVEALTVHDEILAQAAKLPADLIVMGTHGRTGFQRLMLGSVTEKILRMAQAPVLTVGAPHYGNDVAAFTRILCAIDFSECSLAAFRYARLLAAESNARLSVVNVIEWTPVGYDPMFGPPMDLAGYRMAAETAAGERLHKAVTEFPIEGHDIGEIVGSGKPHHEILRIATEQGADLIVLGIHGRNPIDRMLFGSTAEPIVRRASCAVLTVRSDGKAAVAAA